MSGQQEPQRLDRHYDGVLGTSLDLTLYGDDPRAMEEAVEAALAEIRRLEMILTTYDDASELMVLNRERATSDASPELLEVISRCEHWKEASRGFFSCRLGRVFARWDAAERAGVAPIVSELLPLAQAARDAPVVIDEQARRIELGDGVVLDPSGLAKGYIVDRALAVLQRALSETAAIKVDIGGDARYQGAPPGGEGWEVAIADPLAVADNAGFIATVSLESRAVATSGHTSRIRRIGGREFSHILDTRRGWPVTAGLYAVVIAPEAVTADAVATTLSAQNLSDALALVNSLDGVEALLIDSRSEQSTSDGWQDYLGAEQRRQADATISMTVEYAIPDLRERDYERPFVAVWVAGSDGRAIRNLLLLGGEERWARTNTLWWRRAGSNRALERNHVTRPTRGPGEYRLSWDGRDDAGNTQLHGEYRLYIEASREHGGHNYVAVPFVITEGSQTIEQAGEGEVGDIRISLQVDLPD